jgi:hypothetical protein
MLALDYSNTASRLSAALTINDSAEPFFPRLGGERPATHLASSICLNVCGGPCASENLLVHVTDSGDSRRLRQ